VFPSINFQQILIGSRICGAIILIPKTYSLSGALLNAEAKDDRILKLFSRVRSKCWKNILFPLPFSLTE
jgi:hypothetical protein